MIDRRILEDLDDLINADLYPILDFLESLSVNHMIQLGGKRWTKDGKDRIYFTVDYEDFGLDLTNSGARLHGESISKNVADALKFEIDNTKVFFDIIKNEFRIYSRYTRTLISATEFLRAVIAAMKSYVELFRIKRKNS